MSQRFGLSMMQDHDKVKRVLDEYFGIKLEIKDTSLKGWNWGKALIQGRSCVFIRKTSE